MNEDDVELYLAASNEDLYETAQNMVNQAPTAPEPSLNAHRQLQVNVHDIGPSLQPFLPPAQSAVDETNTTDGSPAPSEELGSGTGGCDSETDNRTEGEQKREDGPRLVREKKREDGQHQRIPEVDLTQPESDAPLPPSKRSNEGPQPDRGVKKSKQNEGPQHELRVEKSKQNVGPKTVEAFREALRRHLGFCVLDDYSRPLGAEKISSKCCGAKQTNKYLLHLAECAEHTLIRSRGRSTQPFEIDFSFEDLLHLEEQRWEPKVITVADGHEELKDLMVKLMGFTQEARSDVRRLFARVATENCDAQVCMGTLAPLFFETLAWAVAMGVGVKDRFSLLVGLHGCWRDNKRMGLDLLRSLEDGKVKHLDCRQPTYAKHCRSNQLRKEVITVYEKCLQLWEGMEEEIRGLGYLTPLQQSFLEAMTSAWQTNLSRARYLVAIMQRRRLVVDPLRATWYLLEGPSDSGIIEPLMGKRRKSGWQYVQSGLYRNIEVASQLHEFNKTKIKAAKGETEGQSTVPNIPCANRFSALEEGGKEKKEEKRGSTAATSERENHNKTPVESRKSTNPMGEHYKERVKSPHNSQGSQGSHSNHQGPHRFNGTQRPRSGERIQRRAISPGQAPWPKGGNNSSSGGRSGSGGSSHSSGSGSGGQQNPKRIRRPNK